MNKANLVDWIHILNPNDTAGGGGETLPGDIDIYYKARSFSVAECCWGIYIHTTQQWNKISSLRSNTKPKSNIF